MADQELVLDDLTATERARELVGDMLGDNWPAAWVAIDALMADPDLLVDLAIEAGGLAANGWQRGVPHPEQHENSRPDGDGWEPVYRRTSTEAVDD